MSRQGDYLASTTPDNLSIPRKNKRKKPLDTSVIRKETIREPVNPRKRTKEDTVTDVEKDSIKKPPYFRHKVGYRGDTDKNNSCSDDSPTVIDDFLRNLDKEYENEDYEESKENTSVINNTNGSKISKDKNKNHLLTVYK